MVAGIKSGFAVVLRLDFGAHPTQVPAGDVQDVFVLASKVVVDDPA